MSSDSTPNETSASQKNPRDEDFPLFPQLPAELRLKIWIMALPESRIVKIDYDIRSRSFFSLTKVPNILHVNRESRYEALKFYQLSFATAHAPARIYFDFAVDTVYLDACWPEIPMHDFCRHSCPEERAMITNMAIGDHFLLYADDVEDFASFRSLEKLSLVDVPGRRFHGISRTWYKPFHGLGFVEMEKSAWKVNPKITIQLIEEWYKNWHETHSLSIPTISCVALAGDAEPVVTAA